MVQSRRRFLRLLSALPAMGAAAIEPAPRHERLVLDECHVAGLPYYAGPDLLPVMRPGDTVDVTAEPENPHDAFAVRIEYRGRQIGYVPRNRNRAVARLLEQRARVEGVITTVAADAAPWESVRVRLEVAVPV